MNLTNRVGLCLLGFVLVATGCTKKSEPDGASLKGNPIVSGNILHKVPPIYPQVARAAKVQGTVRLHAIIAADVSVESLDAIDGPVLLRGAAVDAVKQWVYAPYILNGVPRRVDTTVTVNFRIDPQSK